MGSMSEVSSFEETSVRDGELGLTQVSIGAWGIVARVTVAWVTVVLVVVVAVGRGTVGLQAERVRTTSPAHGFWFLDNQSCVGKENLGSHMRP